MIVEREVKKAILHMRKLGTDTQRCEVKEATHDVPKSLLATISAFSNMHGGMIILGLSEKNGFRPVPNFEAHKIYSQLQIIGDQLTPVVRMEIDKVMFEDHLLVVAQVKELTRSEKPCYVTAQGRSHGSYIRSGDGDRHLTPYEIDRLVEGNVQPQYDLEFIEEASLEDLDPELLNGIVRRAKLMFPRVFGKHSDELILIDLGVLTKVNGKICPRLAGLLAAGHFPQKYFPRLEIVFTSYAGKTKSDDRRYESSHEVVGSIPDMLLETLSLVNRHMKTGAVLEGGLRKEIPDYPLEAVREAVANALQHRDYSPAGRGTHVQVNMYSDRLEILSPGGLYGSTTIESLGKAGISSTRNEFLSRLLTYTKYEDGFVVENKGSGFFLIDSALSKASMPPPVIQNSLTFFKITFEKKKTHGEVPFSPSGKKVQDFIVEALYRQDSVSIKELTLLSDYSRTTIAKTIRQLVVDGKVEPTMGAKSPKQRYRLSRAI